MTSRFVSNRTNPLFAAALSLAVAGCMSSDDVSSAAPPAGPAFSAKDPVSIQKAAGLSLRHLQVVQPSLLAGVAGVAARAVEIDARGRAHTRVAQTVAGIPVFGAEAIVHLDAAGGFSGLTDGFVRGIAVDTQPVLGKDAAIAAAIAATTKAPTRLTSAADLQILRRNGSDFLTYRVQLDYVEAGQLARPVVFVEAKTGAVVWSYDNLQTARSREVHDALHGSALPGPLVHTEGGPDSGDVDVDINYDLLGGTYDCYHALFGRDSFDNAGALLKSSVHYQTNLVNAYWNGSQMLYGDGDGVQSRSLALSMDVTAHELTHAVTERTSGLIYAGESGGLNEGMSDIFGNICEWYHDNAGDISAVPSAGNWMVGETIWLESPALRYMSDPALDDYSLDYWTSSTASAEVHSSSGIANLAFYLAAHGGTHPRGKSTTEVSGIGIYDAAQIFYLANTAHLTASAAFVDARLATIAAATELFGADSNQVTQIGNAWTAVGVLPPPDYHLIDTQAGLSSTTSIAFSYPANGATAIKFAITGSSGDADLYVKFGSPPTLTSYDCRPYTGTANETCEFNPARAGTYYVLIHAFTPYSGVTLKVSTAGSDPALESVCGDGLDNDGDGLADCADPDCAITPSCLPQPETACDDGLDNDGDGVIDCADSDCATAAACLPQYQVIDSQTGLAASSSPLSFSYDSNGATALKFVISGGTGDADLYVKFGSPPTLSSYDCRPYTGTNNEQCAFDPAQSGTYYVMINPYAAFANLSLTVSALY